MKVMDLPCCAAISLTPCLNKDVPVRHRQRVRRKRKLISCWPRPHSPLLDSTGTRAAPIMLRIAPQERFVARGLHVW